jgi:hypothetical protein
MGTNGFTGSASATGSPFFIPIINDQIILHEQAWDAFVRAKTLNRAYKDYNYFKFRRLLCFWLAL